MEKFIEDFRDEVTLVLDNQGFILDHSVNIGRILHNDVINSKFIDHVLAHDHYKANQILDSKDQLVTQLDFATGKEVINIEVKSSPFAKDGIFYIILICKDISKVAETEFLWNTLSVMGNIGTWELDIKNKNVSWSKQTYDIHGVLPGSFIDYNKALQFYSKEGQERMSALLAPLLKGDKEEFSISKVQIITVKNKIKWVRSKGKLIRDAKGKPFKIIGTFQDISADVESSDNLRRAYMYVQGLYNNTPALLETVNQDNRIISVSEFWLDKMRLTRDDVINRPLSNYYTDYQDESFDEVNKINELATNISSALRVYTKSDHEKFIGHVISRNQTDLLTNENITLSFVYDVTEIIASKKRIEKFNNEKISEIYTRIEKERKRVAGLLHDSVSQKLNALKLSIDKTLEMPELSELTNSIIKEITTISEELTPKLIEHFNINECIDYLANQYKLTNLKISLNLEDLEVALKETTRLQLYRILQEIFNNAIKHSGASKLFIYSRVEQQFSLTIIDNGHGFDVEDALNKSLSFGLENIKERIRLVNGNLDLTSDKKGTVYILNIPYEV